MRKKNLLAAATFAVALVVAATISVFSAESNDYRVSGPYTSDNLSLYLIHGKDKFAGQQILTLQEALDQKKVTVHETGDVNQLAVENKSNAIVFLQSGDIVRGGKQDRTLQHDMLLQPRSGKVPLPAFCVEQGRWQQRGQETAGKFDSSSNVLAGRKVKLAAKVGLQGQVWSSVQEQQTKLGRALKDSVQASESASSYELTLEHTKVKQATNSKIRQFSALLDGKNDVLGYAFSINGKMNSADVYASSILLKKLWPKLLKSSVVEAASEAEAGKTYQAPSVQTVKSFLAEAEAKQAKKMIATKEGETVSQENDHAIRSTTRWYAAKPAVQTGGGHGSPVQLPAPSVHTNILAK